MHKIITSIVLGGFAALFIAVAFALGIFSISGPSLPSFTAIDVQVSVPEEARITAVEPISLDCRARVYAEVPVEGKREHEAFGRVYRTDRITMHAYGDVDTCVDGSGVEVTHNRDGSTDVVIPGESIVFVRPRVDTVRTADSVDIDKDMIGKIIDAFPWVDDNLGLAPMAYAYAQNVIDAYTQQVIDQGVDEDKLSVTIDGQPKFDNPDALDMGDIEMQVRSGDITCVASEDLGGVQVNSDL